MLVLPFAFSLGQHELVDKHCWNFPGAGSHGMVPAQHTFPAVVMLMWINDIILSCLPGMGADRDDLSHSIMVTFSDGLPGNPERH